MKKRLIFFLVSLYTTFTYAVGLQLQDTIRLNSTIELDEVRLIARSGKKLKKVSSKGMKSNSISSSFNTIMLSPITFNKCATIDYITISISKRSITENEVIQLLFYDVDALGLPNKRLNDNTLIFTIENQNSITIDLSELSYTFCNTVFIGFEKINVTGTALNIKETIKFKARKKKANATYIMTNKLEEWLVINDISLDLTVFYH